MRAQRLYRVEVWITADDDHGHGLGQPDFIEAIEARTRAEAERIACALHEEKGDVTAEAQPAEEATR